MRGYLIDTNCFLSVLLVAQICAFLCFVAFFIFGRGALALGVDINPNFFNRNKAWLMLELGEGFVAPSSVYQNSQVFVFGAGAGYLIIEEKYYTIGLDFEYVRFLEHIESYPSAQMSQFVAGSLLVGANLGERHNFSLGFGVAGVYEFVKRQGGSQSDRYDAYPMIKVLYTQRFNKYCGGFVQYHHVFPDPIFDSVAPHGPVLDAVTIGVRIYLP